MKLYLLAALLLAAGCASTQDKSNPWKVTHLRGYTLQIDSALGTIRVDTIPGNGQVFIFERIIGRMEVDAGYMERLWLQPDGSSSEMTIPDDGIAYYEQLCRCEFAGFHRVREGNISWKRRNGYSTIGGYVQVKDRRVEW